MESCSVILPPRSAMKPPLRAHSESYTAEPAVNSTTPPLVYMTPPSYPERESWMETFTKRTLPLLTYKTPPEDEAALSTIEQLSNVTAPPFTSNTPP
eukprot:4302193-Prymnesium_polylepis.2